MSLRWEGELAVDKLRWLLVHSRVDPKGGDSERTRGEDGVVARARQLERGASAENVDVAQSRPRGNRSPQSQQGEAQ